MFNVNIKNEFIEEKNRTSDGQFDKTQCCIVFAATEPVEEKLNKDVYNFNYDDIMFLYKEINTDSISRLRLYNSVLTEYTQFAFSRALVTDGQNHYKEINSEDYKACINPLLVQSKMFTREEINKICSMVENSRDAFTIMATFEIGQSMNQKNIWGMKHENIHGNTVLLEDGREVEISNTLLRIIDGCKDESEYTVKSRTIALTEDGTVRKRARKKGKKSDIQEYYSLRRDFVVAMESIGYDFVNMKDIAMSGILDFVKRKSKENGMDFESYIRSELFDAGLLKQYGKIMNRAQKINMLLKYGDYLV